MTESIPISVVEGWFNDLTFILKRASVKFKTNADHFVNQGMMHGIAQIEGRLNTWL